MEMDREDGTEFVLSFTVDVNENRAEGCKTHTLQTPNRNCVFQPGPKYRVNPEQNQVTSEGAEINGFQEPDGGTELSLEPKDEFKPDTSGHIRTPDAREPGYFGELGPSLTQDRALDCPEDRWKATGFINSVNGEDLDLWGVCIGAVITERAAGTGGSDGGPITSGETPNTGGTRSSWFTSGTVSAHGIDAALNSSRVNASGVRPSDVGEIHARTVRIGESSCNPITSAEKSDAPGADVGWTITRDVAHVGETKGNMTVCRPVNMPEEDNGDVWEFHASPAVIGESVRTVEPGGNQTTSEETTSVQFTHFHPTALGEGSGTRDSDDIAQETVNMRGTKAISTTSGESVNSLRTCLHPNVVGVIAAIEETDDDLAAPEENHGTECTQVSSGVVEESLHTCETKTCPRIADETVDIRGTTDSFPTSGETEGTRGTSARSCVVEDSSPRAGGETVNIGGDYTNLTTSGENSGIGTTSPGPHGSLSAYGSRSMFDGKTAAAVTGDYVLETGMNQVVSGPVDGAVPQDQVAGNPWQPNDATKAKFATWKNPVHPGLCVGKCSGSCCAELEMKILNGDINCSKYEEIYTSETLAKGVRVGNYGYLVVNRRSTSGASPIPVYSIREPGNAAERQQEVRRTSDHRPETISKPSTANINEVKKQEIEARPEYGVNCSDSVGATRPQTLRTNSGQAVSLSCDSTPLSNNNAGNFIDDGDMDVILNSVELGRRQSAPDKLQEHEHAEPEPSSEQTAIKRHALADFLTRGLFSWRPKESKASLTSSGWRLFGKISPKGNDTKGCRTPHQPETVRRKNLDFEPLSTTGLILEDRPANLPAKPEEEAQRHRQQYDEMMAGAKRRELKEVHQKKKQMKERLRQEESIARAVVVWNTEILPNWENMRNTRRVRDLWWQGLPPSIRGKIWSLAIGNELNITPELYEIFLSRAKEKWRSFSETGSLSENEDGGVDKESSLDLIKLDIFRTFPSLYIFQKGGPYHDVLHNVLGAYTCYRPDVGYVQGMSFIAAVLILNLEEADAFIAFANLLNKPCQLAFFRVDHDLMLKYFAAFEVFFEENLPKLFRHFHNNSLTPDFYLIDWIFTLYSKPLPLDVACRVWDLFCRDGEEALFRTALGILRLYQDVLLHMDFIHIAQFLSRLPQNTSAHTLFTCISNTHMLNNNRRWNQVFSALMKDGPKEADKTGSPALRS